MSSKACPPIECRTPAIDTFSPLSRANSSAFATCSSSLDLDDAIDRRDGELADVVDRRRPWRSRAATGSCAGGCSSGSSGKRDAVDVGDAAGILRARRIARQPRDGRAAPQHAPPSTAAPSSSRREILNRFAPLRHWSTRQSMIRASVRLDEYGRHGHCRRLEDSAAARAYPSRFATPLVTFALPHHPAARSCGPGRPWRAAPPCRRPSARHAPCSRAASRCRAARRSSWPVAAAGNRRGR